MQKQLDLPPEEDDNIHTLLEPPAPAYSSTTVKRAFIVWLHLGQQPDFKHVCNFYHRLEDKERAMTPDERRRSRARELDLYHKQPSVVDFNERRYFINADKMLQIKEVMSEVCVFRLEGFCDLRPDKYVNRNDQFIIGKIIRDYCKSHSKSLRDFFYDFENFTKKIDIKKSFHVITGYIKNKLIKDDLQLYFNMKQILNKQLSFLNDDTEEYKQKKEVNRSTIKDNNATIIHKTATREMITHPLVVRILENEARKKIFLNKASYWTEPRKSG